MFSKDVTDFELVGPVLKAKVRNHKGKMKSVKIDLNKYIGNNEGKDLLVGAGPVTHGQR